MPFYTAQTTIGTASNLTADYSTNTTHWVASSSGDLPLIGAALKAAYDLWRPSMSNLARQSNHHTKFYNREDPEPRAPVLDYTWAFAVAPTNAPLPAEVTLCCSFQGNPLSGVPQARRRGRNYLPWPAGPTVGADGRPSPATITNCAAWGDSLLAFSDGNPNITWVVASTYGVPGEFDTIITNGWVDNEWDTQRRRGRDATARTTWS